jgi:hypothetical protein
VFHSSVLFFIGGIAMKRFFFLLAVLATTVGCGTRDERAQSNFVPTTDAALASISDYDSVYVVYPVVDGAWLTDRQSDPLFIVDKFEAKIVPHADRRRMRDLQSGAVLAIPTMTQFDLVSDWYGEPAAESLRKEISNATANTEGVIKLSKAPPQLITNTDFDSFVAVKCYVQRVREGTAKIQVLPNPSGKPLAGPTDWKPETVLPDAY